MLLGFTFASSVVLWPWSAAHSLAFVLGLRYYRLLATAFAFCCALVSISESGKSTSNHSIVFQCAGPNGRMLVWVCCVGLLCGILLESTTFASHTLSQFPAKQSFDFVHIESCQIIFILESLCSTNLSCLLINCLKLCMSFFLCL